MVTSALVGVSSLNELSEGLENFPLPPAFFFTKLILKPSQKSKILGILLITPVATVTAGSKGIILWHIVVRVRIEVRIWL